jgi:asparagine synthetase B (glutamine-hydrolysing)
VHPRPADALAVLRATARESPGEVLLLSGGLDSSLLSAFANRMTAITVVLEGCDERAKTAPTRGCERCAGSPLYPPGCGFDRRFSMALARALDLKHRVLVLSVEQALDLLRDVVRMTKSYDLALLNNIPIVAALLESRRSGMAAIWSGEMADELFGGYAHHRKESTWPLHLADRIRSFAPPSAEFESPIDVSIFYPYLAPAMISLACALQREDLIQLRESDETGAFVDQFDPSLVGAAQKPWGKTFIRRAAEQVLPREVAWRPKTDLQFGSAMCRLESELADRLTREASQLAHESGRSFRNDAHRALHGIYLSMGLEPEKPKPGMHACVCCGGGVWSASGHCPTCGAFPADLDISDPPDGSNDR